MPTSRIGRFDRRRKSVYGRAGAGRPYGSRFGIATRRIEEAIVSTTETGRRPLAIPSS
jgi:hypothetical protein